MQTSRFIYSNNSIFVAEDMKTQRGNPRKPGMMAQTPGDLSSLLQGQLLVSTGKLQGPWGKNREVSGEVSSSKMRKMPRLPCWENRGTVILRTVFILPYGVIQTMKWSCSDRGVLNVPRTPQQSGERAYLSGRH